MHRIWFILLLLWDEVQVCVKYSFIIYIIARPKPGQVLRACGASAIKVLLSKRTNSKARADRIQLCTEDGRQGGARSSLTCFSQSEGDAVAHLFLLSDRKQWMRRRRKLRDLGWTRVITKTREKEKLHIQQVKECVVGWTGEKKVKVVRDLELRRYEGLSVSQRKTVYHLPEGFYWWFRYGSEMLDNILNSDLPDTK